jgi:MscS family membrane protein
MEFFERTYYGNTVTEWLTAAGIILGAVVVGKILYWICGGVLRRLTAKTKTRLDDIILDMVEEPIVFALTLAGIWYGLDTLVLSESVAKGTDGVLQFLMVMCVAWLITRLLDSLFQEFLVPLAAKSETDLDDQIIPIVRKTAKILVWSIAVIVALNNAGYNVGALIAGLGIGGLALAMAARDTVANVFGGFTVLADRPFVLNDRIKVLGFEGHVRDIGVRSTRIETLEGRIVTIPNANFQDTPIENVSREPTRKVTVKLGLTYDTTPERMRQAVDILRQIAKDHPDLDGKSVVWMDSFGDSSLNLTFSYYIAKGKDTFEATSQANLMILERFNAAGLEFAFPTQTVLLPRQEAA